MADRQKIIATNKSLRLIKNELEHLLEEGILTDQVFEAIHAQLPAESPLSGPLRTSANSAAPPTPAQSTASPAPAAAMSNLSLNNSTQSPSSPAPPAYNSTGPPSLPGRTPAPAAPPSKPVIARAKALYKYAAADDRDLSFERDDRIDVFEYMNIDWWMGRNARTGAEGIFPKNYVEIDNSALPAAADGGYDEKRGYYAPQQPSYASPGPQQQGNGGYPPPPGQQNPYNANVPPMAVAEGQQQQQGGEQGGAGGKAGEMGKKFGKKLGNAAIFGAGATIGSNIVNSIF